MIILEEIAVIAVSVMTIIGILTLLTISGAAAWLRGYEDRRKWEDEQKREGAKKKEQEEMALAIAWVRFQMKDGGK